MKYQTIITDIRHKTGVIFLNRPAKRNAISIQMRKDIIACLKEWEASPEVCAVIVTGSGSVFSAGFDLNEFNKPELFDEILKSSTRYHLDLWYFPKPIIAAINGPALGGGFDLATLCDIRICTETAIFSHPEVKFGAPPLFTPLRWIVGEGVARDLCLTGRSIDSHDAVQYRLVSEKTDSHNLLNRALEISDQILEAPLDTIHYMKKYFTDEQRGFEQYFSIEHDQAFRNILFKKAKTGLKNQIQDKKI